MSSVGGELRRPIAWLVEDNPRAIVETSSLLRRLRLSVVRIESQSDLLDKISELSYEMAPVVVVLDLRLPWADEKTLANNALAGGLDCLELLSRESVTQSIPVVVYSSAVYDDLILAAVRPFHPAAIVDKNDEGRLRSVLENMFPSSGVRRKTARLYAFLFETRVLRVARWVRAATAIGAAIAAVAKFAFG